MGKNLIGSMSTQELAKTMQAQVIGRNVMFSSLSTDTRTLQGGDAYLALRGEHFDGHDFCEVAASAGASTLIVERASTVAAAQLVVKDSHQALADIARFNRLRSQATVIALTGSQGKTTVKEMIGSILTKCGSTHITRTNLNNTIGVPLTLLQLEEGHKYAVIEMGANRAGEIAFSVEATQPDIALLTGASAAHVEGFGSLEGIVEAKGEILDGLSAEGIAVLNADDPHVQRWIDRSAHCRVVLFSGSESIASGSRREHQADFLARQIKTHGGQGVEFELATPSGSTIVSLHLLGEHNAINAAAAAAVAMEAGASLEQVRQGLEAVQPVRGRLVQLAGRNGSIVIDDTYNASPSSAMAAIDVLAQFAESKVLIVGDMKELGAESAKFHANVGAYAKGCCIDTLWACGEFAQETTNAFGPSALMFASQQALIRHCQQQTHRGVVYLVKGSRGARMENVVRGLLDERYSEATHEVELSTGRET
ncbi:MAG: UDP-N-acetylmuramoyl-tripeptide--D-alanyl-D-alanine ligase [Gammaproteobacteria bacterium]|nr:UDP-N-acetylmuramoyl-tripeptide--D-alanyl-D-alanine ligase [Gammaproteobacteria bacterium]